MAPMSAQKRLLSNDRARFVAKHSTAYFSFTGTETCTVHRALLRSDASKRVLIFRDKKTLLILEFLISKLS